VQKFNKTKAKKAFGNSDGGKITDQGYLSSIGWQYISVKFNKKDNPSLSEDWNAYFPIHQLKAYKEK
jgi:hypothetical protein